MFSSNSSVTAADISRLHNYGGSDRLGNGDTEQFRSALPRRSTAPEAIAALLPYYTTPDEARKVYPEPPAAMIASSNLTAMPLSSSKAASTQGKKRVRQEEDTDSTNAPHLAGTAAVTPDGDADGRSVRFAEGFERVNFLGKSFLDPPTSVLEHQAAVAARPCQPPRTLRGVFKSSVANTGREKAAGMQQLRWAPPAYGHLLFAADLSGKTQLWNSGSRSLIATFAGHTQPIKSLEVTSSAALMSTGSVDGTVVLWDVEAGRCQHTLTNPDGLPVVQHVHHPSNEDHLLLAAVDKKIVLYDVRASCAKYQREYTGHMGTVLNLTLLSDGSKMLSTSEDRTLRTWDYRSPVQIKQFADAAMHAISHVVHHPTQPEFLAAQSLDNKVIVFRDDGAGKLRLMREREFTGHTISGTRCQLGFSHDGQFLSSGDISGKLYVWDWATKRLVKSFKAHSQLLASHLWHPIEPSRVVTAAWDGQVNVWA